MMGRPSVELRVFASVARHLSFIRASEELKLSAPAVSMQIKELETETGLLLFDKGRCITNGKLLQAVLSAGLLVLQELHQVPGQTHHARRCITKQVQPLRKALPQQLIGLFLSDLHKSECGASSRRNQPSISASSTA